VSKPPNTIVAIARVVEAPYLTTVSAMPGVRFVRQTAVFGTGANLASPSQTLSG
jgi:hypothetical protein